MEDDINYLFVTCGQGLEPLLVHEMTEMGFTDVREGFRGVYVYNDSFNAIYRINYCSRIGGRVLLPIKKFRCFDQKALYKGGRSINWTQYIPRGKTFLSMLM